MLIAQLSDPHLRPAGRLYQRLVDSNALFAQAVAQLRTLVPAPDLVLLTGDVVEEGTAEDYAFARTLLAQLPAPLLVLPGNHDARAAFRAAFADHAHLPAQGSLHFAVDHGPLRIVGLDVTVPGEHHGVVDEAAAGWLEATLAAAPERPTLLMMHQPPIRSGISCIDAYRCFGEVRLAAVIARHPQVERVLCGHVHRAMQARFGGTLLMTAPSTCTAIGLRLDTGEEEGVSFLEPPAFLLHRWSAEEGLVTHHVPIGRFPGPLPFF
ncbi:phosphodiesterase [Ancylobacter sp. 6x-1]|uniref:Phosphodiesterase n=1 Tax=Ancylobacter crimeensis TaxID=2579147 RepID=A0ABT0D9S6_9HYPH|nr:phosphodiesterase [Ancylobacter crimeensis]MCK0196706.1 phosphodiesterase [Ancylobacter crimeensis]